MSSNLGWQFFNQPFFGFVRRLISGDLVDAFWCTILSQSGWWTFATNNTWFGLKLMRNNAFKLHANSASDVDIVRMFFCFTKWIVPVWLSDVSPINSVLLTIALLHSITIHPPFFVSKSSAEFYSLETIDVYISRSASVFKIKYNVF